MTIGCRANGYLPFWLALPLWISWTVANPQAASGAETPPTRILPNGLQDIPCLDFPPNVFLSDQLVSQHLVPQAKGARSTLAPPCEEAVSSNVVGATDSLAGEASKNPKALNELFDASRTPLERFQNGFDLYSWLTFVALNSPEDPKVPFGTPAAQTVWEAQFLPLDQVIRQSEKAGVGNVNLRNLPPSCLRLHSGPAKPTLFVEVDDVAFDQPFKSGPLVDQNGNYSLNTIFMNVTMGEFIASNHLDSAIGQRLFQPRIEFQAGQPGIIGSIMIKASWKMLARTDDPSEFHTALAYRFSPERGECRVVTLGLVGLHIVHKTEGRRQWIWTTFEHVRNVPSALEVRDGTAAGKSYLFYGKGAADTGHAVAAPATGLQPNMAPPQPWGPDSPHETLSQIVRAQPIADDTQKINDQAREFLKHLAESDPQDFAKAMVWTHYQLISTQWPAAFPCANEGRLTNGQPIIETNQQADPNCSPAPEFLPNSTLETYVQHDIGTPGEAPPGVPQSSSSCIGCHNNAVAYQPVGYGDESSLGLPPPSVPFATDCNALTPKAACSPASDFTFILEQVCAALPDPLTHQPQQGLCKHERPDRAANTNGSNQRGPSR